MMELGEKLRDHDYDSSWGEDEPDLWHNLNVFYLLVQVFNTLLITGDAVVRSLSSREDQICDFSSAEANSCRKLYLNIVRLLKEKDSPIISFNHYMNLISAYLLVLQW